MSDNGEPATLQSVSVDEQKSVKVEKEEVNVQTSSQTQIKSTIQPAEEEIEFREVDPPTASQVDPKSKSGFSTVSIIVIGVVAVCALLLGAVFCGYLLYEVRTTDAELKEDSVLLHQKDDELEVQDELLADYIEDVHNFSLQLRQEVLENEEILNNEIETARSNESALLDRIIDLALKTNFNITTLRNHFIQEISDLHINLTDLLLSKAEEIQNRQQDDYNYFYNVDVNLTNAINRLQEEKLDIPPPTLASCNEYRNAGYNDSGFYFLTTPDYGEYKVYCDMDSEGGGWTLVASVHENDIDGKCTQGDKWSQEGNNIEENWSNENIFGSPETATYDDYKSLAYFNVQAEQVLVKHVDNGIGVENGEWLSYYTDSFLGDLADCNTSTFSEIYQQNPLEIQATSGILENFINLIQNATISTGYHDDYTYNPPIHSEPVNQMAGLFTSGNTINERINGRQWRDIYYGQYINIPEAETYVSEDVLPFFYATYFRDTFAWESFELDVYSLDVGDMYNVVENAGETLTNRSYVAEYKGVCLEFNNNSVCWIFFVISNQLIWDSVLPTSFDVLGDTNSEGSSFDIIVKLDGSFKNIICGYVLLARTGGPGYSNDVQSEIISSYLSVLVYDDVPNVATFSNISLVRFLSTLQFEASQLLLDLPGFHYLESADNYFYEEGETDELNRIQLDMLTLEYSQFVNDDNRMILTGYNQPMFSLIWLKNTDQSFSLTILSERNFDGSYGTVVAHEDVVDDFLEYRVLCHYYADRPTICHTFFVINVINEQVEDRASISSSTIVNDEGIFSTTYTFAGATGLVGTAFITRSSPTDEFVKQDFDTFFQKVIKLYVKSQLGDNTTNDALSIPITYIQGSKEMVLPSAFNTLFNITDPKISFSAISGYGYPYAICPFGVSDYIHKQYLCIGGTDSNRDACGDFTALDGLPGDLESESGFAHSSRFLQSTMLIFVR